MGHNLEHLVRYRGCDDLELRGIISKYHRLNSFFDISSQDVVLALSRFLLEEVFISSGKKATPIRASFQFVYELFCERCQRDPEIDEPPFTERDFIFSLCALDIPIWRRSRALILTTDPSIFGKPYEGIQMAVDRVEFEKRSDVTSVVSAVIEPPASEKAKRTVKAAISKLQTEYEILQFARKVNEIIKRGVKIVELNDILRNEFGAREYMLPRVKIVARERGWLKPVRRNSGQGKIKLTDENRLYAERAMLQFGLHTLSDSVNRMLRDFRILTTEPQSIPPIPTPSIDVTGEVPISSGEARGQNAARTACI